jgi:hypothetical protein
VTAAQRRLVSKTPNMELLAIERIVGRTQPLSRMGWQEPLHLYAMLRPVGRAPQSYRGQVMSALLARGFEHRYASELITRAGAGVQPLALLVREAAMRRELNVVSADA